MSTKINWTDETWNPIIGCSKISPGCKNCYAEKMAYRLSKIKHTEYYGHVLHGKNWNGLTSYHFKEGLKKPLKWKKPRMIFVCSMSDIFHENVSFWWIDEVFEIIEKCPQHTFQILTKRPEIMQRYFSRNQCKIIPDNVWLGVTAENQEQANKRIPVLLQIPAKIHFVSVEPMLSEIDLFNVDNEINQKMSEIEPKEMFFSADYIDWVICGGESGHNARLMSSEWARSLKDQCKEANVPFFFKQGSQNNWKNYKDFDSFPEDLKIREFPIL